jgi:hypothetical protein
MRDITPEHLKCDEDPACPSVHDTGDGNVLVVGKIAPFLECDEDGKFTRPEDFPVAVGTDETAVILSKSYFAGLTEEAVREERERCAKIAEAHGPYEDIYQWGAPARIANAIRALTPLTAGEA